MAPCGTADEWRGTQGPCATDLDAIWPALRDLARLLQVAAEAVEATHGPGSGSDPYRGLYVSPEQFDWLAGQSPGTALLLQASTQDAADFVAGIGASPSFEWLRERFGLSPFDVAAVLLALAPELDLRYERLYAYLQDDVTKKRPTVDLALSLLCGSRDEKVECWSRFQADAPLIAQDILHLIAPTDQAEPPLLAHYVKLDEQITRKLAGARGLDSRLAGFCGLVHPDETTGETLVGLPERLGPLVGEALARGEALCIHLRGRLGADTRRAATGLAQAGEAPLLVADLSLAPESREGFETALRVMFREASLQQAVLLVEDLAPGQPEAIAWRRESFVRDLAGSRGVTIVSGEAQVNGAGRPPVAAVTVPLPLPDHAARLECWTSALREAGLRARDEDIAPLAGRFRLTRDQILSAVASVKAQTALRNGHSEGTPRRRTRHRARAEDLFAAARDQAGHGLAHLANKIDPIYTWADIVLPEEQLEELQDLCAHATHRHTVLGEWGFERKLSSGRGLNALFCGPPGTGKTMGAQVIANELELDLYRIDLAQVVSKYIGETEKNLHRIFEAAEASNAILFFDEADALFGKRSEVKDAHDRYANIEVSYLLQKMEDYDGIAILATNMRENMDDAFVRRIRFIIQFPFPDEQHRRRIWERIFPDETPLAEDVDLAVLAREVRLAGGNIRNIALAGAFNAAQDGQVIQMDHLLRAARREHRKAGRAWDAADPQPPEPNAT